MTSIRARTKDIGQPLAGAWRKFWFTAEPAYTLGLIRIAFGTLAILWTLEILSQLDEWFSTDGIYPSTQLTFPGWGLFEWWNSDTAILTAALVLLISAVALTVGFHSRVAAILVFVLILSFERRDNLIFNAGDNLIRIEALFLALAPAGAALSLDQRRRTGSFWSAKYKEIWPIRLMQIQVTFIYLDSVITKMRGDTWHDGTAVSYSLRASDFSYGNVPGWLTNNATMMNFATWTTLLVELALAVLVWNRRLCPWVIAAGVLLHLGIFFTLRVAFFSPAIFVLYLAFLPPEQAMAVARWLRKTLAKLPGLRKKDDAESGAAESAKAKGDPVPTPAPTGRDSE